MLKHEFHPPHLYQNDSFYFITARTIAGKNYLESAKAKVILFDFLKREVTLFGCLYGWAILNNHYHILIKLFEGDKLGLLMNKVNGGSSYKLNKFYNQLGRKIWYQYWDRCVRSDKDFYTHLNYIHQNPIKHGLVENLEELVNYQFCSYQNYLMKFGSQWLENCFEQYPVVNFINPPKPPA